MRRRQPLTALRAFETVARTGSFSAAARELWVTRPAVSKQVRLLEEELGCALLDRSSGTLTLTRTGAELSAGLKQAFDLIAATIERVRGQTSLSLRIRILVERDFASSWLAEYVGQFLVLNPGTSVEITAEKNGRFRMDEDYSFRIFYGPPASFEVEMLVERELCRWIDLPLCTPEYAQPLQQQPDRFLVDTHLLHDRNYDPWEDWLNAVGFGGQIDTEKGTVFNETSLCLSAAVSGAGITIGDSFLAFSHIKSGTLVPPFPVGVRSREAYMIYHRRDVERTPAELAFEKWIIEALTDYKKKVDRLFSKLNVRVVA